MARQDRAATLEVDASRVMAVANLALASIATLRSLGHAATLARGPVRSRGLTCGSGCSQRPGTHLTEEATQPPSRPPRVVTALQQGSARTKPNGIQTKRSVVRNAHAFRDDGHAKRLADALAQVESISRLDLLPRGRLHRSHGDAGLLPSLDAATFVEEVNRSRTEPSFPSVGHHLPLRVVAGLDSPLATPLARCEEPEAGHEIAFVADDLSPIRHGQTVVRALIALACLAGPWTPKHGARPGELGEALTRSDQGGVVIPCPVFDKKDGLDGLW